MQVQEQEQEQGQEQDSDQENGGWPLCNEEWCDNIAAENCDCCSMPICRNCVNVVWIKILIGGRTKDIERMIMCHGCQSNKTAQPKFREVDGDAFCTIL